MLTATQLFGPLTRLLRRKKTKSSANPPAPFQTLFLPALKPALLPAPVEQTSPCPKSGFML